MNTNTIRRISAVSVLAAVLGAGATMAHAEQVQARVISSSPVTESNGSISYHVTYEYAGRQYTTRTHTPPGASIWVDANSYGITSPVPPPEIAQSQGPAPQHWDNVVPEQGVVVSGSGIAPAPAYAAPAPVYAAPAPVYVQPAPVYYPAPAYYPPPAYSYPPIGISLGFGYSRGWR